MHYVLSMVDAPYAPCKTTLRCGAAAMGCITVLLWYTRYNYAPLKQSLEDDGYAPEKHSYIHIKEDGTVLNGNRRTHLMQKELSMDQDEEVECEVKTKSGLNFFLYILSICWTFASVEHFNSLDIWNL